MPSAVPEELLARLRAEMNALGHASAPRGAQMRALGPVSVLLEVVEPPPRVFLVGSGHDAVPLMKIGASGGPPRDDRRSPHVRVAPRAFRGRERGLDRRSVHRRFGRRCMPDGARRAHDARLRTRPRVPRRARGDARSLPRRARPRAANGPHVGGAREGGEGASPTKRSPPCTRRRASTSARRPRARSRSRSSPRCKPCSPARARPPPRALGGDPRRRRHARARRRRGRGVIVAAVLAAGGSSRLGRPEAARRLRRPPAHRPRARGCVASSAAPSSSAPTPRTSGRRWRRAALLDRSPFSATLRAPTEWRRPSTSRRVGRMQRAPRR